MLTNYEAYPVWQDIDRELQRLYLARFGDQPVVGGNMVGTLLRFEVITAQDLRDWQEAIEPFNESRSAIMEVVADGMLE